MIESYRQMGIVVPEPLPHVAVPFVHGRYLWRMRSVHLSDEVLCAFLKRPCTPSFTQEKRLASKREDFEKMKELSAHMDNVVKRLMAFFPLDNVESEKDSDAALPPPVAPDLPPLTVPPPTNARDSSASARVLTMDRAVSARRLMTDRAVSVASGLHFDDIVSGETSPHESR